ncbi:aspartyl/asparaginyl beta-hydroxylase domain-containing protein [Algoriphagus sp.]|uniref:aspartyl/asparaginyl beta-hydroxylase domain-containing protein n=1 Tax=Algoriphagus sp. TaxID=1872435 RepID=UPI0025EC90DA|nr:aspartyl/asparaginyl beta-hydroxylase domain-containing protein [Algoriphagus sp.]
MLQTDRIKFPFQFDVKKLQDEVSSLGGLQWDQLFVRKDYKGDWSVISLTAKEDNKPKELLDSIDLEGSDFVSTPSLQKCPYISSILELFECDKYSVRLMKLAQGAGTVRLLDQNLGENEVRILVPVFSNPLVTILLNDSVVDMKEGDCWYLKISDPHLIRNEGETDLIHLVLDLDLNDWIRDFLKL